MTHRLPDVGGDDGAWGAILNDYLSVSLAGDGTIQPGAVGNTQLDSTTQTKLATALPNTTKLSGLADTGGASAATNNQVLTYNSGTNQWVPTTVAGGVTLDSTASDIQPLGTQTAGATGKAADAGHVHPMPRLDQVGGPTADVSLGSHKITGLANGSVGSDAAAFGQIPVVGTTSGTYAAGNDGRITGALQASNNLSDIGSAAAAFGAIKQGATNGATGVIQLAGDLAGSATNPTVAKLNGVTLPASAPSANQVLTATNSTTTTWTTPAGGVTLDSTASDIQPLGNQAAGAVGKAADAGHVHPMPRLDQVGGPTADVSLGTHKITNLANGTTGSDAAAFGQIPVAGTSSSTYAAGNDSRITGALQSSNNLSDTADAGTSRLNLHVPGLAVCKAVATSNITLSGLQTIDGYTTLASDLVLCTGQTTASQNGPWLAASGSWTRPHEYNTGASLTGGRTVSVANGTVNAGTSWLLTTAAPITVDTTATTWTQTMVYYAAGAPPLTVVSTIAGSQTAGSEYTYTVPSGQYQRLLSWFITATTSSTVANRFFGYRLLDEHGNVIYMMRSAAAVTATSTMNMSISSKAPQFVSSNAAQAQSLHLPDMWLWPGCQLVTSTSNGTAPGLQSGDQYTAMSLFFEQISATGFTYP